MILGTEVREEGNEQRRVANTMAAVMGNLLLNSVGENMSKNHSFERRKEKRLPISAFLHWSRKALHDVKSSAS